MMSGVRIAQPPGPLAVSSTNPRYFSAAAAPEEAVYLTGSHVNNYSAGEPSFDSLEPARYAMGNTRGIAEQINLITMLPRTDLSSTGFALSNPGTEYLILQPSETADPFAVDLLPGQYTAEWHGLSSRESIGGATVTGSDQTKIDLSAPSGVAGPAVVHLRRISS